MAHRISFAFENPLRVKFMDEFFQKIPQDAGVYAFLDQNNDPLYIGKASNLRRRLMSYRNGKPGRTAEHILEMMELAQSIKWEIHASGDEALKREALLIRTLRPPFNIAGTHPVPFLFCGFHISEGSPRPTRGSEKRLTTEFRLSHQALPDSYETFGCFYHRGKTKAGYSALLRLIYASTCERERFHLPAKICRTSPAYIFRLSAPESWVAPLRDFLSGQNIQLLHLMTKGLLENESLPPYLYAPLQRDIRTSFEFFQSGPEFTRKAATALKVKKRYLTSPQMEAYLSRSLKDFHPLFPTKNQRIGMDPNT